MIKPSIYISLLTSSMLAHAQLPLSVTSPDGQITVKLEKQQNQLVYSVNYGNQEFLQQSQLGLNTNLGDFSQSLKYKSHTTASVNERYKLHNAKVSEVNYTANTLKAQFENQDGRMLGVEFNVSDSDVAFRYQISGADTDTRIKVLAEYSAFNLPDNATTFISPQALPETGWMQTKPSYEEPYTFNEALGTPSANGVGYTFPALFKNSDKGWLLISETGVDSHYVGSKLSEGTKDGVYRISFPQAGENNGIGATYAAMAMPATTPWRTITLGASLKPIVESTVAFDLVKPLYQPSQDYKMGRSTWSWIVWQDPSINYDDQIKFIDLAASLNFEYVLIDNWWDKNIGRERMAELVKYANGKGVDVILWYNSNGWWNDAPQTPQNRMNSAPARRNEMAWLQSIGVKGLKVDFFGGDKQETIKLYEDILTDANQYGLVITFHGSTIPRGWERMYPNFVTSEAVLASENLVFHQNSLDLHAYNATILPFTRNAIGAMDFAPVFLNKRLSQDQTVGTIRKTTDTFELATGVLYQSPVQHFGLTPNNLEEQPQFVIDTLKAMPTVWDETRYIAGQPGQDATIARRHQQTWWVAAVNGENKAKTLDIDLPMLAGKKVTLLFDNKDGSAGTKQVTVSNSGKLTLNLLAQGGALIIGH